MQPTDLARRSLWTLVELAPTDEACDKNPDEPAIRVPSALLPADEIDGCRHSTEERQRRQHHPDLAGARNDRCATSAAIAKGGGTERKLVVGEAELATTSDDRGAVVRRQAVACLRSAVVQRNRSLAASAGLHADRRDQERSAHDATSQVDTAARRHCLQVLGCSRPIHGRSAVHGFTGRVGPTPRRSIARFRPRDSLVQSNERAANCRAASPSRRRNDSSSTRRWIAFASAAGCPEHQEPGRRAARPRRAADVSATTGVPTTIASQVGIDMFNQNRHPVTRRTRQDFGTRSWDKVPRKRAATPRSRQRLSAARSAPSRRSQSSTGTRLQGTTVPCRRFDRRASRPRRDRTTRRPSSPRCRSHGASPRDRNRLLPTPCRCVRQPGDAIG